MPRRIIAAALVIAASVLCLSACGNNIASSGDALTADPADPAGEDESDSINMNINEIIITVGGTEFTAVLSDTEAARDFCSLLPLTISMDELNGNEKYHYLDSPLTSKASRPDMIHSGDLMLYGSSCIVIFYESFSTSYTYTALGHITDADGLKDALGAGSVTVTFSAK